MLAAPVCPGPGSPAASSAAASFVPRPAGSVPASDRHPRPRLGRHRHRSRRCPCFRRIPAGGRWPEEPCGEAVAPPVGGRLTRICQQPTEFCDLAAVVAWAGPGDRGPGPRSHATGTRRRTSRPADRNPPERARLLNSRQGCYPCAGGKVVWCECSARPAVVSARHCSWKCRAAGSFGLLSTSQSRIVIRTLIRTQCAHGHVSRCRAGRRPSEDRTPS